MWTWPEVLSPQEIDPEQREIVRFSAFWMTRERVDLDRGHVKIFARPVEMSLLQWRRGWMAHNKSPLWTEVGRVVRDGRGFSIEWLAGRPPQRAARSDYRPAK